MHRPSIRTALAGAATAAVVLLGGTVGLASAQTTTTPPGTVTSACDNPVLSQGLAGWGKISGSNPVRVHEPDVHPSAIYSYVQGLNQTPTPRAWLPQVVVDPAHATWNLGADARSNQPGQMRALVDWYSTATPDNSGYLGQPAGPWVATPGGGLGVWKRIAAEFTAPPGAVRGNVLLDAQLPVGANWGITACSYRPVVATETEPPPPTSTEPPPTTTEEPPPTTTTPPVEPPPGDGTEAAVKYGWGAPLPSSDEFNYIGAPNGGKWGVYNGPGHAGNGTRDPARVTVDGSKLVMTGLSNGASAGMASQFNQRYGRWEARVRSFNTGPSGNQYHPLLIIWPQSNQWPAHGEYDFLENGAPGMPCAEAFLHYPGHTPKVQEYAKETNCGAPLSDWHNVALQWTPQALVGYIDGKEWFRFGEHDMTAMPSGHLTIQLDNFYGSGMRPASYEVDWVRIYAP